MSEYRVASRYAKSIIGLALERDELNEVHNSMELIRNTCMGSRQLVVTLKSPVIHSSKKLDILMAVFGSSISDMVKLFVEILCRKNRVGLLYDIAIEFHAQYNVLKGIKVAHITTAVSISEELRDKFRVLLRKITQTDAEIHEKVDPEILGGFILRVGDIQLDDSLKNRLVNLKESYSTDAFEKKF